MSVVRATDESELPNGFYSVPLMHEGFDVDRLPIDEKTGEVRPLGEGTIPGHRVCSQPDCGTVLSKYNEGRACKRHQEEFRAELKAGKPYNPPLRTPENSIREVDIRNIRRRREPKLPTL